MNESASATAVITVPDKRYCMSQCGRTHQPGCREIRRAPGRTDGAGCGVQRNRHGPATAGKDEEVADSAHESSQGASGEESRIHSPDRDRPQLT